MEPSKPSKLRGGPSAEQKYKTERQCAFKWAVVPGCVSRALSVMSKKQARPFQEAGAVATVLWWFVTADKKAEFLKRKQSTMVSVPCER